LSGAIAEAEVLLDQQKGQKLRLCVGLLDELAAVIGSQGCRGDEGRMEIPRLLADRIGEPGYVQAAPYGTVRRMLEKPPQASPEEAWSHPSHKDEETIISFEASTSGLYDQPCSRE
jgi:hypothetical protein